jgi:hypothetical protein
LEPTQGERKAKMPPPPPDTNHTVLMSNDDAIAAAAAVVDASVTFQSSDLQLQTNPSDALVTEPISYNSDEDLSMQPI